MRLAVVTAEVLALEQGLWCADCLLSTGVALYYVTTTTAAGGGSASSLRIQRECSECGGRDVEGAA